MPARGSTSRSDILSPASERVNSLQPPSIQARSSSYITSTSGGSRTSGLSDFPVSPPNPDLVPLSLTLYGLSAAAEHRVFDLVLSIAAMPSWLLQVSYDLEVTVLSIALTNFQV